MTRVVVLALLLAAGSCAPAANERPPAPRTFQVEIHNFAFAPASVEARVGDTIAFVNRDFAPHTATETASRWGTEQIDYGKSAFVVATTAGRFVYHCHFHPEMTGVLIVASR